MIREHIPLEQGLRQHPFMFIKNMNNIREHIPLEQGLRLHAVGKDPTFHRRIREHIPLEQGLRLFSRKSRSGFPCIREHIPLEQGLRHESRQLESFLYRDQRAYSIRTRIKTDKGKPIYPLNTLNQRAYSIRTRIKT